MVYYRRLEIFFEVEQPVQTGFGQGERGGDQRAHNKEQQKESGPDAGVVSTQLQAVEPAHSEDRIVALRIPLEPGRESRD